MSDDELDISARVLAEALVWVLRASHPEYRWVIRVADEVIEPGIIFPPDLDARGDDEDGDLPDTSNEEADNAA